MLQQTTESVRTQCPVSCAGEVPSTGCKYGTWFHSYKYNCVMKTYIK